MRGLRDACGGAVVRSWLDLCANMMRTRLCVATPWATLHPILARETSFLLLLTYSRILLYSLTYFFYLLICSLA